MQESKGTRAESNKSTEELKAERQSDATDDQVLREEEKGSSGTKSKDNSPSPDGAFDEREQIDEAGPL